MDSDSDTDEETQNRELQQLTDMIKAEDALRSNASQYSSYSVSTGAVTEGREDARDTAIALNQLMSEKMGRVEQMLVNRLTECRKRLEEFRNPAPNQSQNNPECVSKFKFVHCGRPYFKDNFNFPAPDNEDTILQKQSGFYDFSCVSSVPGWTVNDKIKFKDILLKMSIAIRTEDLQSEIKKLTREGKTTKVDKKNQRKIANIRQEMNALKNKSLDEIALPIEREYDWDAIAVKLNCRHNAQEYRSMWKLFLHPSINKKPWSKAEHLKLQKIANANHLQNWDKIAEELNNGRTGYQCFIYYRTNATSISSGQKWTPDEEAYLTRLIDFYRVDNYIPWGKIASAMGTRNKIQVYNKYSALLVKRKGRFLPEEDAVILACHKKFGKNFAMIAKYLPGRSPKQVQVRSTILLNRSKLSVVWTPEEDKRLVQIVSNSDTAVNYCSITHLFPGKDRGHLRTRFFTLEKWMKRHPFADISEAPRRASRRLTHGDSTSDITVAVEGLQKRMQKEVSKNKSRITKNSSKKEIEEAIIALLANEEFEEEAEKKRNEEDANEIEAQSSESDEPCSSGLETDMHRTLILLRAKLDKKKFVGSVFEEKYPGLTSCNLQDPKTLKCYSKKPQKEPTNSVDIWGGNTLPCTEYYMPPNYDTITGCRKIMKHVKETMNESEPVNPTFAMLEKNNGLFRQQKRLLMARFSTIFLWPALLSSISPSPGLIGEPKKIGPGPGPYISQEIPLYVKRMENEPEVNEVINLEDDEGKDDIIITPHVGNDDYLYLPPNKKQKTKQTKKETKE